MSIDRPAIIAYLSGESFPDELRRVDDWRAAAAANEEEFQRIARLWRAAGELEGSGEIRGPTPGQIVALAETRSRYPAVGRLRSEPEPPAERAPEPAQQAGPEHRKRWIPWPRAREVAIATALVAGVVLGFAVIDFRNEVGYGQQQIVTGVGESATVTLNDGTVVRVAPESRVTFPNGGRSRDVSLQGRAYFTVAEDHERPFLVHLPDGEVRVLGTRFEVQARNDGVQVAVVEGRVRLSTRGQEVGLEAKQVARASGPSGAVQVEEIEDVFQVVDWLGRFLAFESTPMDEVVDEFERRFGTRIEVADSGLMDRRVTGWFADQPSEQVIAAICAVIEAQCLIGEGTVRIESRSVRGG